MSQQLTQPLLLLLLVLGLALCAAPAFAACTGDIDCDNRTNSLASDPDSEDARDAAGFDELFVFDYSRPDTLPPPPPLSTREIAKFTETQKTITERHTITGAGTMRVFKRRVPRTTSFVRVECRPLRASPATAQLALYAQYGTHADPQWHLVASPAVLRLELPSSLVNSTTPNANITELLAARNATSNATTIVLLPQGAGLRHNETPAVLLRQGQRYNATSGQVLAELKLDFRFTFDSHFFFSVYLLPNSLMENSTMDFEMVVTTDRDDGLFEHEDLIYGVTGAGAALLAVVVIEMIVFYVLFAVSERRNK